MNDVDKGKLKVLIKQILLEKSPRALTANQLTNIINKHKWGFSSPITSAKIGKLLTMELKMNHNHFLDCIVVKKRGGTYAYQIPSRNME